MKYIKPTAYILFLFSFLFSITACEKDTNKKVQSEFTVSNVVMNSAQETPANASTATGNLNYSYTRETHILSYNFSWTGLTGVPVAMHIHGLAPKGFAASVFQTFTGFKSATAGSYTGTLLIDGVSIKEQDLLNGLYYVNIHTAANPGGEIRGQISF